MAPEMRQLCDELAQRVDTHAALTDPEYDPDPDLATVEAWLKAVS